jgi:PERQ amino acid-rich with GYF domain-containing protein
MAATTMHFGPEWMRKPVSRPQQPSPPPTSQSALSTYSALVSTTPSIENDKQDDVHPFRYTKEELLKIYKESPKVGLGLEVERWEGVVRDISNDPVALREMSDGEKKVRGNVPSSCF